MTGSTASRKTTPKARGGSSARMKASARKDQILTLATGLFSRLGFEKMTLADLAEECGITEAALYRYFDSKETLYAEVLQSLKSKIDISSLKKRTAREDDVEKILFAVAEEMLNTYTTHPEISRLLLFCSLQGHDMTRRVYEIIRVPYIEILSKSLERLKRKRKIRPVNTFITARCFTGMLTECAIGMNLWQGRESRPRTSREAIKNNIPIFARGLKY